METLEEQQIDSSLKADQLLKIGFYRCAQSV